MLCMRMRHYQCLPTLVMLSDEKKLIFIHIPKTGGTSVERAFGRACCDPPPQHAHPMWFLRECPEKWEEYTKITHIRNPWARYLSGFNRRFPEKMAGPDPIGDFSAWLRRRTQSGGFPSQIGWLQRNWTEDSLALDGIDHVFMFPEIVARWAEYGVDLPHVNRGNPYPPYQELYSPESRDLVAEHCADDIERWGFEF